MIRPLNAPIRADQCDLAARTDAVRSERRRALESQNPARPV